MRILLLHSDFIEYQPISKEVENAEDIQYKDSKNIEDVIVALIAIEKDHTKDNLQNLSSYRPAW